MCLKSGWKALKKNWEAMKESRRIMAEAYSAYKPKEACAYTLDCENEDLLKAWEIKWEQGDDHFKKYFKNVYQQSCTVAERNRDYNFWGKSQIAKNFHYLAIVQFLFLVFLTVVYTSPAWVYCLNKFFSSKHSLSTLVKTVPLDAGLIIGVEAILLTSFLVAFISKSTWLNVKKYQETWARHRLTQNRLLHEMLRFLDETEPYNEEDLNNRKQTFVKRTLTIIDENVQLFSKNMTEKEVPLLKDFFSIEGSKDKS